MKPTTADLRLMLGEFLSFPVNSAENIFSRFERLPGAISGKGATPLQRYVCIPGVKENKLVLIAHADTVWDDAYGHSANAAVCYENGIFKSANPDCGIGGDDRAGCAMLWALRNSGHTILLVNGEEKGKHGAKYLKKSNPALFRQLNQHRFMIELDWQGTGGCLYHQVDYTKQFHAYITNTLGFQDDCKKGGCDLQILCQRICGVNIGVGYHKQHSPKEYVSLEEWENTYRCLCSFLERAHPRFAINPWKRCKRITIDIIRLPYRIAKKCLRLLKKQFAPQ